jgi:hypothetical protein
MGAQLFARKSANAATFGVERGREYREERNEMHNGHAAGASKSLKKTTKAIMKFLADSGKLPQRELRAFQYEKLGDFAVKWYRKGFNRGHRESAKQSGKACVPTILRYNATREFFTGDDRTVHLNSTLKRRSRR